METLFNDALQEPPESRQAFLDAHCGADEALRREVERLLLADSRSASFLTTPVLGRAFVLPAPESLPVDDSIPRVGPYRLVRVLGSGGIGHVWLARREDGHFEKDVALKVLKRGMDSDAILDRFRNERQMLARLEHPHIARLLDGGTTDDGLPYLVMEFVDGMPIDQYCHRHHLPIDERLRLMQKVCRAVQYAHQNLVVHRDIKPGNVVVALDGEPKLLDFGIAKVLGEDGHAGTLDPTQLQNRFLTPEYASPEQLRGEPVTTTSDVFSLGVLLYELVTTLRPAIADPALGNAWQLSTIDEPLRPSTRVRRAMGSAAKDDRVWPEGAADRLIGKLRGDLDTIVLKALRRGPSERYGSAAELSEDLGRFLERRPVLARPQAVGYRVSRFLQRNPVGAAAASMAILAVLGGLITSFIAYAQTASAWREEAIERKIADEKRIEADDERQRSVRESEKTRSINAFMQTLLLTENPNGQLRADTQLRELLDRSALRLSDGVLSGQPEVEAAVRTTIGRAYALLQLNLPAEEQLRRALSIREGLFGFDDLEAADILANLAGAAHNEDRFDEAIDLNRRSLEILERSIPERNDMRRVRRLVSLSSILRDLLEFDEAERLARDALEGTIRLKGPADLETAASQFHLGWILMAAGKGREALTLFESALAIRRKLLGPDHASVGETLAQLGRVQSNLGQLEAATRTQMESYSMLVTRLGQDHPQTHRTMVYLARLMTKKLDLDEASAWYARLYASQLRYYGDKYSRAPKTLVEWACSLDVPQEHLDLAERSLRKSLESHRSRNADGFDASYDDRAHLAFLLAKERRFEEAEALYIENLANSAGRSFPRSYSESRAIEQLSEFYDTWSAATASPLPAAEADRWRHVLALLR